MMVERHYDDEALLTLLEGTMHSDAHLTSCPACSEKLDNFRTVTEVLHERDVWDKAQVRVDPVPATIANLRAFANRMSLEDTAADAILPQLLAGAREAWMPRLTAHPEWRTAGVVRKLVEESSRAIDTMPPDAVEITGLATEIADHLQPTIHGPDAVYRLQGTAWRQRAYALFFVGDFTKAERAVTRAEGALAKCAVADYDQARVAVVRALILRAFERLDEAVVAAASGAEVFSRFGDLRRTVTARMAEVHSLISRANYPRAVEILEELERSARNGEADLHAHVLSNLGYATWKSGQRPTAIRHFDFAGAIFDALGSRTEAVRIRWNVAAILAEESRIGEAKERLKQVINEFDLLAMAGDSALASLDLAELLLAESDFGAVDEICYAAMRSFEHSGVAYTTRAVTALGYIRECAQRRTADQKTVGRVRDYLRRLPSEPTLLFAERAP